MQKWITLLIILFLGMCKNEPGKELEQSMGLLALRGSKATVSGTVVKGIIKNANAAVYGLNADGSCSDVPLVVGTTGGAGEYSLNFLRTGSAVCLVISPNSNGQTSMYDEKTMKDISVPSTSKFRMMMILPESKITGNSRSNLMISPFSRIISKRLQFLMQQNPGQGVSRLHTRASRELVIRFGLNQGLSSKHYAPRGAVSEESVPELDEILLQLDNPSSSMTAKFVSVLVGLSHLASKYKSGGEVSVDDLDSIIEAFAADFADGTFDGKTPDGKPITIGSGANQITFSGDPLATVLLPSIVSYFQEGGTLSVGLPSKTPPPVVSASSITSQIQFAGNVPITSNDFTLPATTIAYTGSPFNFLMGQSYTINPTVSGNAITACTASPSLPAGLSLSSTCVISGSPTVASSATNYSIAATYSNGVVNTTIVATTTDPSVPPSGLSYTGTPFNFIQNQAISSLSPAFTGVVNSFSVTPTLPAGLVLNTTTGVISGTPTGTQAGTSYTITATNEHGDTNTSINIAVQIAPPSALSYPNVSYNFFQNSAITNQSPTVTGTVTSYSVSPALPAGLNLNTSTGVISGTPTSLQASSSYTVTATNGTGSTNVSINIAILIPPPSNLTYPSSQYHFTQGTPICAFSPTVTGTVTSYSVSPTLPTGISLNATTGEFTGTPSGTFGATSYTVSATNSSGSTQFIITLSVSSVYLFTNAGQTGRTGPTQGQVNTAYSCSSLNGAVTINTQGIQEWTVPATGTYRMEVAGAQGGSNTVAGGLGATITADFTLTAGQVIKVLVGQTGTQGGSGNRGGGGGSFVWLASDNSLFMAAGGGGGAGGSGVAGLGGSASTSGTLISDGSGTAGTSGNGSNGAGWLSDGDVVADAVEAASRPLAGGIGGIGYSSAATHDGGFGGGAGGGGAPSTIHNAGGGGGYSGGAGVIGAGGFGGGGGGSFISASGTNGSANAGNNAGNGFVKITKL